MPLVLAVSASLLGLLSSCASAPSSAGAPPESTPRIPTETPSERDLEERSAPSSPRAAEVSEDQESDQDPGQDDGEAVDNPCRPKDLAGDWLDSVERGIYRGVCNTARWFDGFFGDARFDSEAESTWGRLSITNIYDEFEDLEAKVRFRAEVDFPNLDHRLDTFFGREDEDDFVAGRNDGFESLPGFFRDAQDQEWLVGLGYRPVRRDARPGRFDVRLGVKVRFPLEPFVQGRYRRYWFVSDSRLVRFRNTVFWRNQRGFGETVSLDFEQALGRPFLFRLSGTGTFSESTEGVDWNTSATLYHGLGGLRAMAYTLYIDGETDSPVTVERYGFRAVYRRQMLRKWLFGQVITGLNFPRPLDGDRETSFEVGFGIEIHYGRKPADVP